MIYNQRRGLSVYTVEEVTEATSPILCTVSVTTTKEGISIDRYHGENTPRDEELRRIRTFGLV